MHAPIYGVLCVLLNACPAIVGIAYTETGLLASADMVVQQATYVRPYSASKSAGLISACQIPEGGVRNTSQWIPIVFHQQVLRVFVS